MRRVVWENVTRWACLVCEKSVEIREICGRQISAQCAKEQAGCFYSPTDLSDKHRCHADCLSITQIAPSARQIDTDFSHAENLSMRARFNGYAPRGQKFIAQRQAKRRPGYNVLCSLLPDVRAKVLNRVCYVYFCPCRAWRDGVWRFTQGVASLALGYGDHWAFQPAWVNRAMRYHCLFSPLGLTGLYATMGFSARFV